jgi:hypothetical protein
MRSVKMIVCAAVAVAGLLILAPLAGGEEKETAAEETRQVDLAICLDTSGSMTGLINAARQKLWDIVSELALAQPTPDLRVALFTYGTPAYGGPSYVRIQTELTSDLDTVYEKLMALGTSGGDEYVGWVLHEAAQKLAWAESDDALKLMFVAGNESADQARNTHDFRDVCAGAIKRGIMVNSIYCGNPVDDIAPGWREVAQLADGHFSAIDQNNGLVVITTPFDSKIAELGSKLNGTYVPFGAKGQAGYSNQAAQDANSAIMGIANSAARYIVRSQSLYNNGGWDLVDARNGKDFELSKIKTEDLPENMREMTIEKQDAYLDKMEADRKKIQDEVNKLAAKRRDYIEAERQKMKEKGDKSFDAAVLRAVRDQAAKKNFTFKENFAEGEGNE